MESVKGSVKVPISKIVIVDENHGGYLAGFCLICDNRGWIDGKYGYASGKGKPAHLTHKKSCPMNKYALKKHDD